MITEKPKSVPLRMCVICKQMRPKSDLLRVVLNKEGKTFIDETHRANGRGAYICTEEVCLKTCVKKKILNKVFKQELPVDIYTAITGVYESRND